jgi:hypothetical protein
MLRDASFQLRSARNGQRRHAAISPCRSVSCGSHASCLPAASCLASDLNTGPAQHDAHPLREPCVQGCPQRVPLPA